MTASNPQDVLLQGTATRYSYNGAEYAIDIAYSAIKRSTNGTTIETGSTPGTIDWTASFLNGLGEYVPYTGLFKVYENTTQLVGVGNPNTPPSTNGSSWQWASSSCLLGISTLTNLTIELYAKDDTSFSNLLAKQILPIVQDGAPGADAVSGIFISNSNQSHGIPTASDGSGANYLGSGTELHVYNGTTELTYDGYGAGTPADNHYRVLSTSGQNITPSTPSATGNGVVFGTHSAITADAANITYNLIIKLPSASQISMSTVQNFQRVKSANETTVYQLINNTPVFKVDNSGSNIYTPTTLTAIINQYTGTVGPTTGSAFFRILTSTDGISFPNTAVANSTAATTVSYSPSGPNIKAIKVQAYTSNSYSTLIEEEIVPVAQDGASGVSGQSSFVVQLTNETHSIPTDYVGANGVYTNSGTEIHVYEGATELTYAGNVTSVTYPNSAGSYYILTDSSNKPTTYSNITPGTIIGTVVNSIIVGLANISSNITNDTAYITYTVFIKSSSGSTYIRIGTQSISRNKTGQVGIAGSVYVINAGTGAVQTTEGRTLYNPSTITPKLYGADASNVFAYPGRIRVLYDTTGAVGTFQTAYSSTTDETAVSTPISCNAYGSVNSFKVQGWKAGGFLTMFDEEIVPIVSDGSTGPQGYTGDSIKKAYVVLSSATTPTTAAVVTTGATSLPYPGGSNPFGLGTTTWYSTPQTPAVNQTLWVSEGIYAASTNQITWTAPYIAYLKVGQLSAISADMGSITAGTITMPTTGWIKGGKTSYADSTAGIFLGYDSSAYKFKVGNSTNYLDWNGSTFSIAGPIITASNFVDNSISESWLTEVTTPYVGAWSVNTNTAWSSWAGANMTFPPSGGFTSAGKLLIYAVITLRASNYAFYTYGMTAAQGVSVGGRFSWSYSGGGSGSSTWAFQCLGNARANVQLQYNNDYVAERQFVSSALIPVSYGNTVTITPQGIRSDLAYATPELRAVSVLAILLKK